MSYVIFHVKINMYNWIKTHLNLFKLPFWVRARCLFMFAAEFIYPNGETRPSFNATFDITTYLHIYILVNVSTFDTYNYSGLGGRARRLVSDKTKLQGLQFRDNVNCLCVFHRLYFEEISTSRTKGYEASFLIPRPGNRTRCLHKYFCINITATSSCIG